MTVYGSDDETLEQDQAFDFLAPAPRVRSITDKGRARDTEAVRLRARGWTLEEICDALDLGDDTRRAAAAIRRGLGSMVRFATDEHREMELRSLDELEHELWKQLRHHHPLVDRGTIVLGFNGDVLPDDRFVLETVDRILKVKHHRADLLGLKAPTRAEIITIDSIDAEIARLERELSTSAGIPED